MRIKFKAPDPRAGQTAEMDSSRGQYFIDTGAAVAVKDGGKADGSSSGGPKPPSDGLTVAQLKEALAAKRIVIPDGITLKADLAKLLDDAAGG